MDSSQQNYQLLNLLTLIQDNAKAAQSGIAATEEANSAAMNPKVSLGKGPQPPTPAQCKQAAMQQAQRASASLSALVVLGQRLQSLLNRKDDGDGPDDNADPKENGTPPARLLSLAGGAEGGRDDGE